MDFMLVQKDTQTSFKDTKVCSCILIEAKHDLFISLYVQATVAIFHLSILDNFAVSFLSSVQTDVNLYKK